MMMIHDDDASRCIMIYDGDGDGGGGGLCSEKSYNIRSLDMYKDCFLGAFFTSATVHNVGYF